LLLLLFFYWSVFDFFCEIFLNFYPGCVLGAEEREKILGYDVGVGTGREGNGSRRTERRGGGGREREKRGREERSGGGG
jgi:hypothetical protein